MKKAIGWIGTILLLVLCGGCASAPPVSVPGPVSLPALSDGVFRVQIDPARGGAIVGLTITDGGETRNNVVNSGDVTGRQIQASLYDGHWGPDCWPCNGTCPWGWNPVQEGDACERPSGGSVVAQTPTSITTTTMPRQWNSASGFSKITLQQTVTAVSSGILRIDYQVTNHEAFTIGSDNWHELPCAYLDASFTLGAYVGAMGLERPSTTLTAFQTGGEPWVAASDANGWTVALYAPGSHPFSIDFGGDTKPTTLLQAWQWLELAPEQTDTATTWIVVGRTLDEVRRRIGILTQP